MANLKDLIKNAQRGLAAETVDMAEAAPEKRESPGEGENSAENSRAYGKEEKGPREKPARRGDGRRPPPGTIAQGIRDMEKGSPLDRTVSVRVSAGVHKRLLIYGQEGMKMQAVVSYAIDHLLRTKEMQDLFNKIKNDME